MKHLLAFLIGLPALALCSDIAVITITVGEKFQADTEIGINNKREYCEKHGYHFINCKQVLDEKRKVAWSKVLLTQNCLAHKDYKWVMWIDADTLIMDMEKKLEDIIDENYDLIIGNEGTEICSGVYLIKNSKWSKKFLEEVYDEDKYLAGRITDHEAFDETYKAHNLFHTKVLPLRELAAFAPEHEGSPAEMYYQPGDFIIHFEHLKNHEGLKELFAKYAYVRDKEAPAKVDEKSAENSIPAIVPSMKIDAEKIDQNIQAFLDKFIIPPTYKGIINDYLTFVKETIEKDKI